MELLIYALLWNIIVIIAWHNKCLQGRNEFFSNLSKLPDEYLSVSLKHEIHHWQNICQWCHFLHSMSFKATVTEAVWSKNRICEW